MATVIVWTVFDCERKKCPYMWEMHPEMFGEYCAYKPLSKRRHTRGWGGGKQGKYVDIVTFGVE